MGAHNMLGPNFANLGRFDTAQDHLEKSIALYKSGKSSCLSFVYGENP